MRTPSHLTIGEIASLFNQPAWRVRKCVDSLGIEIPRAGQYRLVPRDLLGRIAVELEHRGRLPASSTTAGEEVAS